MRSGRPRPCAGAAAVDVAPAEEAAEGEARHEGAQHRAHGEHGGAEDDDEHARPDDLVDEAAGAGEEEQARDDQKRPRRQVATGRSVSGHGSCGRPMTTTFEPEALRLAAPRGQPLFTPDRFKEGAP